MDLTNITVAASLTEEQVELMTGPQLVTVHNTLAAISNVNAVTKFKDRATGIRRVMQLIPVAAKVVAASAESAKKTATESTKNTERKARQDSLSAKIRQMILDGMDNRQILTALDLPSEKNHYPTWYRCEMRRKGIQIPTPQASA